MKSHTPGPWKVSREDKRIDILAKDHRAGSIRITFIENANPNLSKQDRAIADAHLIAAAPDLMRFAKEMEEYFVDNPKGYENLRFLCERALAKAEGRKS